MVLAARRSEQLEEAAREVGALSTGAFDATDSGALADFFQNLAGTIDHVMVTGPGPSSKPGGEFRPNSLRLCDLRSRLHAQTGANMRLSAYER